MSADASRLCLFLGGCRSGKSGLAQRWAEAAGPRRLYIATAEPLDTEMAERIARHRRDRGQGWTTAEAPLDPARALLERGGDCDAAVVDCLTVWLSNLLLADMPDTAILEHAGALLAAAPAAGCRVALVANEVGLGVVPPSPLGRRFRDLAGFVNQLAARAADRVVFTAAGLPLILKGTP